MTAWHSISNTIVARCDGSKAGATSTRLPEDGDVSRIAAEALDVVADPFEREHDVLHPDVGRGPELLAADFREVEESERIEPVAPAVDAPYGTPLNVCTPSST